MTPDRLRMQRLVEAAQQLSAARNRRDIYYNRFREKAAQLDYNDAVRHYTDPLGSRQKGQ